MCGVIIKQRDVYIWGHLGIRDNHLKMTWVKESIVGFRTDNCSLTYTGWRSATSMANRDGLQNLHCTAIMRTATDFAKVSGTMTFEECNALGV